MRLLYLCQQNPWRLNSGGLIRNYWVVRGLAERFEVDLVTAETVDPASVPADFAAACANIEGFPRPVEEAGRNFRTLGALDPRGSFFTADTVTRAMAKRVRDLVATRGYAAAVFDLKAWSALRKLDVPIVYHGHNCEWKLLERRAELESEPRKSLIALDARRVRTIERTVLERARATIVCSSDDLRDLAELVPATTERSVLAPNGVDVARYAAVREAPSDGSTILLTGSFDWRPNQQGAQWFVERVLPELRKLRPRGWDVRIAGRMTEAFAAQVEGWGATAVPNPPLMEPELQRAHIVAAPILASSGTRLRILEAWAAGRPVVTTHAGAFGLPYTDGVELYARDEPAGFARGLYEIMYSPERWRSMRATALERVDAFDWSAIASELGRRLEERLTRSA